MNISAKDVKDLREKTGLGMMECKKALEEAGGDSEHGAASLGRWETHASGASQERLS